MEMLIAAAVVFLGIHLLIAGTRLRDVITGAIGENAYLGLFSLASLGVIVWLVMAYNAAEPTAENVRLYSLSEGVHDLGIVLVALAFFIGVQGLLMPNPTSLKQESFAAKEGTIHVVLLIARHPFLWGFAMLAGVRLAVGRAVVGMVIAEFFTTISGLGAVIINSANNFDTATMFVPIIILMVMAVGLNALVGFIERKVAPWQAEISGRDRE